MRKDAQVYADGFKGVIAGIRGEGSGRTEDANEAMTHSRTRFATRKDQLRFARKRSKEMRSPRGVGPRGSGAR